MHIDTHEGLAQKIAAYEEALALFKSLVDETAKHRSDSDNFVLEDIDHLERSIAILQGKKARLDRRERNASPHDVDVWGRP